MKKIFGFVVKFRIFFIIVWVLLLAVSIYFIPKVKINYDATAYLPEDMNTKKALAVMEEEFGLNGQAQVLISDVNFEEAIRYKNALKEIDFVMDIMWLDNFIDSELLLTLSTEAENLGIDLGDIPGINQFYKDKKALLQIIFDEDDYSVNVGLAVEEIREYLSEINVQFAMSGTAVSAYYTRALTESEIYTITLFVIPIILLILLIFTNSWVEPLLFLMVVGISVIINMGTNIIFPSVSFLTNSSAALLQMAIVMDYAIFLLHSYTRARKEGLEVKAAMQKAMSNSFLSICASMLTTVAGFVAIMFMRYSIGLDLGLVMVKGIILSILCVFTLMPGLIILFSKILEKTRHKSFTPKLTGLVKIVYKYRYVLPVIIAIIIIPIYTTQSKNNFLYGDSAMSTGKGTKPAVELQLIEETFGKNNQIVILVSLDNPNEKQMIKSIGSKLNAKGIKSSIQAYSTLTDFNTYIENIPEQLKEIINDMIPPDFIEGLMPEELKQQFLSPNYSRIIISINTDKESTEAFSAVTDIKAIVHGYYRAADYYLIGSSTSVKEIKEVVESDYKIVNLLSVVFILLILLFTFRSITLPIILVLGIELAVWINMSIPYLTNNSLIFIGYMIVSCVQLGATIDYGILLTNNYLNHRKKIPKRKAFVKAILDSGASILTSALILISAGYALAYISSIEGVAALGELIGRGALLSAFLVLFLLPQLLFIFDKFIGNTTYKSNFLLEEKEKDELIIEEE